MKIINKLEYICGAALMLLLVAAFTIVPLAKSLGLSGEYTMIVISACIAVTVVIFQTWRAVQDMLLSRVCREDALVSYQLNNVHKTATVAVYNLDKLMHGTPWAYGTRTVTKPSVRQTFEAILRK